MIDEGFLEEVEFEMEQALEHCGHELAMLRTGRASAALLDGIMVEAYETRTPLRQLANVTVPEARMMVIQPYDKSVIGEMEKAISLSDIGLNPTNDGNLIRIAIPQLTEDRRRDLVKVAKRIGEEGRVAIRNVRRKANEDVKKEKDGQHIPEDDVRLMNDKVQKITDDFIKRTEKVIEDKVEEIMKF